MEKRVLSLDIAKGLGILIVMVWHLIYLTMPGMSVFKIFFGSLMFVYFFISGYTYKIGKRSIGQNILHRAKQLLIPFVIYKLICYIIGGMAFLIMGKATLPEIGSHVISSLPGTFNPVITEFNLFNYILSVYWFLEQLFLSSVIFFLFADYALKNLKRLSLICGGLLGISAILIQFGIVLPWNLQCSPMLVTVMLIGAYCGKKKLFTEGSLKGKSLLFSVIIAFAVKVVLFMISPISSLSRGMIGTLGGASVITATIQGICGSYVLINLCRLFEKNKISSKVFSWLGNNTIPFLLLHMLFGHIFALATNLQVNLDVMAAMAMGKELNLSYNTILETIAVYFASLILCIISVYVKNWVGNKLKRD